MLDMFLTLAYAKAYAKVKHVITSYKVGSLFLGTYHVVLTLQKEPHMNRQCVSEEYTCEL